MKKIFFAIALAGLLLMGVGVTQSAFAATVSPTTGTIVLSTNGTSSEKTASTVTLSSGVYANYLGSTTGYGIATVNGKGATAYGLSSASSQIYYQPDTGATAAPTDVTAGKSTWTSTWTPMGQ